MWEKIRKWLITICVIASVLIALIMVETEQYENPGGMVIMIINYAFLFWFGLGNMRKN